MTHNRYIENIDVATDTLVEYSRERGSSIRCLELVWFHVMGCINTPFVEYFTASVLTLSNKTILSFDAPMHIQES